MKLHDLTGQRFGKLTVKKYLGNVITLKKLLKMINLLNLSPIKQLKQKTLFTKPSFMMQ